MELLVVVPCGPGVLLPCLISIAHQDQQPASTRMNALLPQPKAKACGRGRKGGGKRGRNGSDDASDGIIQDCEIYVEGKEQKYLKEIQQALGKNELNEVYSRLSSENASSPSFYLYSADLVLKHSPDNEALAARICTNCLEINIQDIQMMRSVGYFLVKCRHTELALAVLDRVRDLAPVEPQSFLDGALARSFCIQHTFCPELLRQAIELTRTAITHKWASRFDEVEWPALVLLHMLVQLGEQNDMENLWPLDAALRTSDFYIGFMVWLAWDTDNTDIDLHVVEPSGNEVYYSNNRSQIGGNLSKDFRHGYGPEVYLCKEPPGGKYTVKAKYYSSHQQSTLTGTTSAVIWALQCCSGKSEIQFDTVRLDKNKEMMEVMDVFVADGLAAHFNTLPVLRFTDTDGDVIEIKREGFEVNEYVNGTRAIANMKGFSICSTTRTYQDDTGIGTFEAGENVSKCIATRDKIFAEPPKEKSKKKCVLM